MPRSQSRAELQAELERLNIANKHQLIMKIADIALVLIKYGTAALIVLLTAGAIKTLAGQTTTTDIGIRLFTDLKISEGLAYLFGGGGVLYGYSRRRQQRKYSREVGQRLAEMETSIDPNRTSSGLTPTGDTTPED